MRVFIINEHPDWLAPLGKLLDHAGIPWLEWYADAGQIDLDHSPPEGVYFNRMSASAQTRGHTYSVAHTRELIAWLSSHGRRVINDARAFELEMSKVRQHAALKAAGICTPRGIAVVGGRDQILAAAGAFGFPLIIKPNRGGKGLGVRLADSAEQLDAYLRSVNFEPSPDGVYLIQEYIRATEPVITRCEFVGGEFIYALSSSTADGFELCPADGCAPCSVGGKFRLLDGFDDPIIPHLSAFARSAGLDVCGIEFVRDGLGRPYVYDINGTTNYNSAIEHNAARSAGAALVALLSGALVEARSQTSAPPTQGLVEKTQGAGLGHGRVSC